MIHRPGKIDQIDSRIFVGDSESYSSARSRGIGYILNLSKGVKYPCPKGVECHRVPLTDDEKNSCEQIQKAIDTLAALVKKGKVLVHCRAGISRSPSIIAAYYAQYQGWTLNAAIDAIKEKRNIVDPGEKFWATLVMCSKQ